MREGDRIEEEAERRHNEQGRETNIHIHICMHVCLHTYPEVLDGDAALTVSTAHVDASKTLLRRHVKMDDQVRLFPEKGSGP